MVNYCQIITYGVTVIMFLLTCIALDVTRLQEIQVACWDAMWSMLMATFVLHALVMPCVLRCMIIQAFYFGHAVREGGAEGVLANKSIFLGSSLLL